MGKTNKPSVRLNQHIRNSNNEKSHKWNWIKSLRFLGLRPEMAILDEIDDPDDTTWPGMERFWISYLRFIGCNLTNLDSGGEVGKKQSPETVEKMRKYNKERVYLPEWVERIKEGRKNGKVPVMTPEGKKRHLASITGVVFSEERKRKISLSKIGKPRTPETKEKLRVAASGKSPSHETRKKLSEALKKRVMTDEHVAKIRAAVLSLVIPAPVGQKFSRYTVLGDHPENNSQWLCACDCGKVRYVYKTTLRNGKSRSCGCLGRDMLIEWHRAKGHSTTASLLTESASPLPSASSSSTQGESTHD